MKQITLNGTCVLQIMNVADCLNKNNYLIRSNNWLCNPAGKELWLEPISTNNSE
jgi:hypothetical protein